MQPWPSFIASITIASSMMLTGSSYAQSTAKKGVVNPLLSSTGPKTCQNTSYPGFRGAKKSFNWTTSPDCHVFSKGKHLVCENASGGVVYVETSSWDAKSKSVTTRFYISEPYKDYDVTTYTWDRKDDTFHSRGSDGGLPTHATRKYYPNGATIFRYAMPIARTLSRPKLA